MAAAADSVASLLSEYAGYGGGGGGSGGGGAGGGGGATQTAYSPQYSVPPPTGAGGGAPGYGAQMAPAYDQTAAYSAPASQWGQNSAGNHNNIYMPPFRTVSTGSGLAIGRFRSSS